MKTTRLLALAVTATSLLCLPACGNATPYLDQDKLEAEISSSLEKEVGQRPDKITCPGDLKGEVGETMRCTLTAGTDELGVTVEVTKVDGKDIKFTAEVDQMDDSGSAS